MAVSRPNIVSKIGIVPASNHGGGRPARPTHITDHHVVGDAAAALAEAQKPSRQVSFTYTIGSDGTIYQALPEMTIPYTDGNGPSNRRALTIEHAGGHPNVPYTEAMYRSSIHLHAWLRQEFGIPVQNILGHKQVSDSPTACPGGLDTERIKRESTIMLEGGSMNPIKGDIDQLLPELWGRGPNPEDYGFTQQSWHDFIYNAVTMYPFQNRRKVIDQLYPQAVKDLATVQSIANIRGDNFTKILVALAVQANPDETKTTELVLKEIERLKFLANQAQNGGTGGFTQADRDTLNAVQKGVAAILDALAKIFKITI